MEAAAPESSEERIAALLRAGELREAAAVVLRAYGPQILGYLCAVLRDEETAQEVFSQFAEDLWSGLRGFRGEASARVWAWRLAWHAAARHARDPYRRRGRRLETGELSRIAAEVRSTTTAQWVDDRSRKLAALRAALTPDEQTLLILRVDKGLPWSEVAFVLSAPGAAVEEAALRKRFERVKAKLARRAREEGLVE
jgi:RNA polymerase sigma-70 factor (ECF subfamily)